MLSPDVDSPAGQQLVTSRGGFPVRAGRGNYDSLEWAGTQFPSGKSCPGRANPLKGYEFHNTFKDTLATGRANVEG